MKVEILLVSWAKDIPYLNYCLKSISKFAIGFSGTTLVVPIQEAGQFSTMPEWVKMKVYNRVDEPVKWHLAAQVQKCYADAHCPDADFICHLDSDTIFTEPVTPEDYFVDGKPVMLYQSYASLPPGVPWQEPTARALGYRVENEFMRRHPQVNPSTLYWPARKRVAELHGQSFDDYALAQKPTFPWGLSEHNFLGAFAYQNLREQYHWIDVEKEPWPKSKLAQFWSHGAIDASQPLPQGGNGTPFQEFKRLGLA